MSGKITSELFVSPQRKKIKWKLWIRSKTLSSQVMKFASGHIRMLQFYFHPGWGVTEERTPSNVMMKAKIPKMEKSECASRLGKHIPVYDTYICAGGITKIDTCFGDSGGPLFALAEVDGKHRAVQYGIVASGVGCEDLRDIYPGVYTNIAFYMKWILDSMKP